MNQVPESAEHCSEYGATGGPEKRIHHAPPNDATCGSFQSQRKNIQLVADHRFTIWRRIELLPQTVSDSAVSSSTQRVCHPISGSESTAAPAFFGLRARTR